MEFPRIYSDETFPLPGYDGYTFRVLVNPTGQEKTDWWSGIVEDSSCPDCARLRAADPDAAEPRYCELCQELRARKGRAAVVVYGASRVAGFDFSTSEASLATFLQPALPDDLLGWLLALPDALWNRRREELKKKLSSSSTEATPS